MQHAVDYSRMLKLSRLNSILTWWFWARAYNLHMWWTLYLPLIALAAEPLGAVEFFKRASGQLAQGHDLQALGNFQRALSVDPQFVPAQYNLATTYLRLGQAEQAIEAANKCSDSRCAEVAQLAQEYLGLLTYTDTFEGDTSHIDYDELDCSQYARLLQIAPKSKDALHRRAQCYLVRGSSIEAVQDLTALAQNDQSDYTSAARAAVGSFVLMDQRQAAFALLRRCVQFDDSAKPCRDATKQLRKLDKLLKDRVKLKDLIKEVSSLRQQYELGAGSDSGGSLIEGVRAQKCASLAKNQRWEQAAKMCAQVRDVDADFPPALLVQAHLEFAQGNGQSAQEIVTKIVRELDDVDPKIEELAKELYMEIRAAQQQRQQQQYQQYQQRQQGGGASGSSPDKDYYKMLGVSEKADNKEIRRAYRQLSKQYHPDKLKKKGGDTQDMSKMQELNEAYEVLSNDEKRQDYDAQRSGNFGGGGGGGFAGGGFPGGGFPGGGFPGGGFPGGGFPFEQFFH